MPHAPAKSLAFTPLEIDVMVSALRRIIDDSGPCRGPADEARVHVLRGILGRLEQIVIHPNMR